MQPRAPFACLGPEIILSSLEGAHATRQVLSNQRGASVGARSLVRCWCTQNPLHATADTSSATSELALWRSKRMEPKAPFACLGPEGILPSLAGAHITRQVFSNQRGASGGTRSLVRCWCTRNPVHATADTSSATSELTPARSRRGEPKALFAYLRPK